LTDYLKKHTTSPVVTGSSVCAIRTPNFVIMAADTLASYGSLARYHNVHRIRKVGDYSIIGAGGEISDFQTVMDTLTELETENFCLNDGITLRAPEIHSYLTRVCYNRRSRMNPYYNQFAIGGVMTVKDEKKDEKKEENKLGNDFYLGYTDLYGTTFVDNYVATGMGGHIALPLLRKHYNADMTIEQARRLLEDCLRVLYYRDCRSVNKILFASVTREGVMIHPVVTLQTYWDMREIHPVPNHLKIQKEEEKIPE